MLVYCKPIFGMPDEDNFYFFGKILKGFILCAQQFQCGLHEASTTDTFIPQFFTSRCIFYTCIVQQTTLNYNQTAIILRLVYFKSTSWNAKWGKFYFLGKYWKLLSFVHCNFNAAYMRQLLRITLYCSFFTLWCIF